MKNIYANIVGKTITKVVPTYSSHVFFFGEEYCILVNSYGELEYSDTDYFGNKDQLELGIINKEEYERVEGAYNRKLKRQRVERELVLLAELKAKYE